MVSTQGVYILQEVGKNIDDEHLSKFLAFLIVIYKELNPKYFRINEIGRKRVYPHHEMLGLHFWGVILMEK